MLAAMSRTVNTVAAPASILVVSGSAGIADLKVGRSPTKDGCRAAGLPVPMQERQRRNLPARRAGEGTSFRPISCLLLKGERWDELRTCRRQRQSMAPRSEGK